MKKSTASNWTAATRELSIKARHMQRSSLAKGLGGTIHSRVVTCDRRSRSFRIVLLVSVILILPSCIASSQKTPDLPPSVSAPTWQPERPSQDSAALNRAVDQIIQKENEFLKTIRNFNPVVETYIQNLRPDLELGTVPISDEYFLGKLDMSRGLNERSFLQQSRMNGWLDKLTSIYSLKYMPLGFAQMIFVDSSDFDRQHYSFTFVRKEFLGDVRCLVFDLTPLAGSGNSRFLGRIWVEDEGYHIVRLNGTFTPHPHYTYKLDFDSWRVNPLPGLWLPAYIYSQQSDQQYRFGRKLRFKAQTRLWGYDLQHAGDHQEFTQIMIDEPFFDHSGSGQDLSPLMSLRKVQYSAEENVVERLQIAGLMAPKGNVDQVLQTVVRNLEITNNLLERLPDVRCRILLTTPMESFSIGHTIVLSRGLIDVLPDEATLAAILAHELAHIVLGHSANLEYSFNERMFFPDEQSLRRLTFHRDSHAEEAADQKALELLSNSPYKDQLKNAGLFFEALEARAPSLSNLIRARLGNALVAGRLAGLKHPTPQLAMRDTDQVAALPLGSRIKLDPWSDRVELVDIKPVPLLNAGEKMPFEVAPFYPYLKRVPIPGKPLSATDEARPSPDTVVPQVAIESQLPSSRDVATIAGPPSEHPQQPVTTAAMQPTAISALPAPAVVLGKKESDLSDGPVAGHGVVPPDPALVERMQVAEVPESFSYPIAPYPTLTGQVSLKAVIGIDGNVREVDVVSGDRTLAGAAVGAVRQWRYHPHQINGNPVEAEANITISFAGRDAIAIRFGAAR